MKAPKRVAIMGDGQMGLVLASLLAQKGGFDVRMWGYDARTVAHLAQTRTSPRLKGFVLPEGVRVVPDAPEALNDADLIVAATPTQFMRPVWASFKGHVPEPDPAKGGVGIVSVAKGLENGTELRPTQVLREALADDPDRAARPLATLSGPTIANEMARCLPATIVSASDDAAFAELVQRVFTTSWLRVYTSMDPLGVELAGATKNVIAIAAGILDGLHAGYNAKSALLARGLAEIARLGTAMGADPETFAGLAGAGDLATTCFSPEGRNRTCGEALGKGESLDAFIQRTQSVVEGVATTKSVVKLASKYKVEMPITRAVHAVLYEGLDPIEGIARLMNRPVKQEHLG